MLQEVLIRNLIEPSRGAARASVFTRRGAGGARDVWRLRRRRPHADQRADCDNRAHCHGVVPTATPEPPPLQVVTTTNIMADWVENIGGGHIEVTSLLGEGADPHTFQPGARDVTAIADADLVLSVGLGLEGAWLIELLENAARDASTVVDFDETIDPIEFGETHIEDVHLLEELSHVVHEVEEGEISAEEGLAEIKEAIEAFEAAEEGHHEEGEQGEEKEEDHEEGEEKEGEEEEHHDEEGEGMIAMVLELIEEVDEGHMDAEEAIEEIEHLTEEGEGEHEGHGHGIHDPHFWFDPLRVKVAVEDIAARLSELDPDNASVYFQNASDYGEKLDELHAWTQEQVAAVPQERRLLVTSHDSFGYFAELYGFEVVGVVLSITTDVEPSAEHIVELVHEVEELGVPAVFGETTVSERLAQTVAHESGRYAGPPVFRLAGRRRQRRRYVPRHGADERGAHCERAEVRPL